MSPQQAFCGQCGSALHGANFCGRCGVPAAAVPVSAEVTAPSPVYPPARSAGYADQVPAAPQVPSQPMGNGAWPPAASAEATWFPLAEAPNASDRPPAKSGGGGKGWLIAGVVVLLVVVGAVAAFLLTRSSTSKTPASHVSAAPAPSYRTQVAKVFAPVVQANARVVQAAAGLTPAGSPTALKTAVASASTAVQTATASLASLQPAAPDRPSATAGQAALTSEAAWLTAVTSSLTDPSSPSTSQLESLGVEAQTKLSALASAIPGTSTTLPSSAPIVAFAQAATSAATTQSQLQQFDTQIQALLTQSADGFTQINQLFGQLEAAATNGDATISLAQAEQIITTVVSNRSALVASTAAVNAPTPAAAAVRTALGAALTASLTDDQDINSCLNEANDGNVAFIFQSCLNASTSDSQAATDAKQNFLGLYNQLRSQIGLPPTTQQF